MSEAHEFRAKIAGLKKDDVKVEVSKGNVLHKC